jgi:hypothetical protein
LTDVLAPALGIGLFAPEYEAATDVPSPEFAEMKLSKALDTYKSSVLLVHEECRKQDINRDPDRSILKEKHVFFGKEQGIPSL